MITDATVPSISAPSEITISEALRRMRTSASAKFHESIDVTVRLGIDPKRSDMAVRGVTNLPHTGLARKPEYVSLQRELRLMRPVLPVLIS